MNENFFEQVYASMPSNVIDSGYVNKILEPRKMPAAIVEYVATENNKWEPTI
jgi:chemotaxis response regulator CheB